LAEDLLLLVTDSATGRLSAPAAQVDAALGGANLLELTLMNKVDLSGEWDQGKPGRIIVRRLPHPHVAGSGSQPRGRSARSSKRRSPGRAGPHPFRLPPGPPGVVPASAGTTIGL
jgi:Golgi phosphoprotein 3 (GPP34)